MKNYWFTQGTRNQKRRRKIIILSLQMSILSNNTHSKNFKSSRYLDITLN